MTGMRNSNMIVRLGVLCGCGLIGPLCADELTLDGGARLTGTVRSINEAGVVELASELSPEPVLLKRGTVEKVEFSIQRRRAQAAGAPWSNWPTATCYPRPSRPLMTGNSPSCRRRRGAWKFRATR